MQAIQIKYIGPTNSKSARLKAWIAVCSMTRDINHSLPLEENARYVAEELLQELGWQGVWVSGSLPNQDFVFVCTDWEKPLKVIA